MITYLAAIAGFAIGWAACSLFAIAKLADERARRDRYRAQLRRCRSELSRALHQRYDQ